MNLYSPDRPALATEPAGTESDWLTTPCVDLAQVAARLYNGKSRLHTRRLQKKLAGHWPFESWEVMRLRAIRLELLAQLKMRPENASVDFRS